MKYIILGLLVIYQKTLSPDYGFFRFRHPYGFCRLYPSCSEYAYRAVDAYGIAIGVALAVARIVRCNPFVGVAIDPVPPPVEAGRKFI